MLCAVLHSLTFDELLGAQLRAAGAVDGVDDDGILQVGEGGDGHQGHHVCVDRGNVGLRLLLGHEPFLAGASLAAKIVRVAANGAQVEGVLFRQHVGVDGVQHLLEDAGQVRAHFGDQPFLPGDTIHARAVLGLCTKESGGTRNKTCVKREGQGAERGREGERARDRGAAIEAQQEGQRRRPWIAREAHL